MSSTVVWPRVGRDPEYLAFMRRVAQARADAEALGIEEEREGFARNAARLRRAPMAEVRDLTVPGGDGPLRARLLFPPQAGDDALVYVHGGGWFLGDLDGWEPVARVIAEAGGNLVAAAARHVDGLALQALVYPAVDLTRDPEDVEDPDGIAFPPAMAQTRR